MKNEIIIPINWITGQSSCTLIIPKFIVDEIGLNDKNTVLLKSKNSLIIKLKENMEKDKCQA